MSESVTFALGIPHTPWVPERAVTMQRLRDQLVNRPQWYKEFTEREPNWSWSEKLWSWGIETGATHLLQLQDDVIVDSGFWTDLRAMVEAVPDQIIGLESVHPVSRQIYDAGGCWYTTNDGLIGVGYVMPRNVLVEFETWRRDVLRPGANKAVSEDTMIDMFCMSTGRKVWHPVPTIIDHDVAVASTYGNDRHTHRRPVVTTVRGDEARSYALQMPTMMMTDVTFGPYVNHLGRFYTMTPRMCRRWVKGFHMADFERCSA